MMHVLSQTRLVHFVFDWPGNTSSLALSLLRYRIRLTRKNSICIIILIENTNFNADFTHQKHYIAQIYIVCLCFRIVFLIVSMVLTQREPL